MKETDKSFIIVGKIGTTYGVQGWVKIQTFTEYGADILNYLPWYISSNEKEWVLADVENSRISSGTIFAKFAKINSPEEARLLTGKNIAVTRQQLPKLKKNEYYWSDLIGLTVVNKRGEILGKVIYLMSTGSNDVLVVKKEKEHAIPYLFGEIILEVDLKAKEIHVDWELL